MHIPISVDLIWLSISCIYIHDRGHFVVGTPGCPQTPVSLPHFTYFTYFHLNAVKQAQNACIIKVFLTYFHTIFTKFSEFAEISHFDNFRTFSFILQVAIMQYTTCNIAIGSWVGLPRHLDSRRLSLDGKGDFRDNR